MTLSFLSSSVLGITEFSQKNFGITDVLPLTIAFLDTFERGSSLCRFARTALARSALITSSTFSGLLSAKNLWVSLAYADNLLCLTT